MSQISIKKNIIGKANFFFNEEFIEEVSDSLETEKIDNPGNAVLLGKVSGNFILPTIVSISNGTHSFSANVGINGEFSIVNAVEGDYQLVAFQDRNNNQLLDTGSFIDNVFSEKFSVYPDTLSLRSNWEIEIADWRL